MMTTPTTRASPLTTPLTPDFVADAEDEAEQDYDDFASDEDVVDAPASVVVAPPLLVPPPRPRKAQE
jgi:hypothetical protein